MTKEQIEAQLAEAYEARSAILKSQEYKTQDGRTLKRADLAEVNRLIVELERKLSAIQRGGIPKMTRIIPNVV